MDSLALGAYAYVAKPIQTTGLLNEVNEISSRKGAQIDRAIINAEQ